MEELVAAKVVFRCPIFEVEEALVRLPDGSEAQRWYVLKPPAVGVLPVDEEGRLVLTQEYLSASGAVSWRVVMGSVEPGETPLEAARREMREEIGLDASEFTPLFEVTHPSTFIKHRGHFFLARGLFASPLESGEFETVQPVPCTPDQVRALMAQGEFQGNFARVLELALKAVEGP